MKLRNWKYLELVFLSGRVSLLKGSVLTHGIIVTQTFLYTASDMESPVMDSSSDDVKTKYSHSQDGKIHTCHDSSLYICF